MLMKTNRFTFQAPEGEGGGAGSGGGGAAGGQGQGGDAGASGQGKPNAGAGDAGGSSFAGQGGKQEGTPPGAGGVVPKWAEGFKDNDLKNWLSKKGDRWPDLEEAFRSHRQLEGFRGVGEDQLIRIAPADQREAWHGPGGIYERLGRPPSADKYDLPKVEVGEGEINLIDSFRTLAFEEGLNNTQAKTIATKIAQQIDQATQAQEQKFLNTQKAERAAVEQEWGEATPANMQVAITGAKALGFDPSTPEGDRVLMELERALGTRTTLMKMFEIGSRLGEGAGGAHGQQSSGAFMTPAQAKVEISRLEADPEFNRAYLNGGKEQNDRMRFLFSMAYPPGSKE